MVVSTPMVGFPTSMHRRALGESSRFLTTPKRMGCLKGRTKLLLGLLER